MEKSFVLRDSRTVTYDVFKNMKKLGGACLLLDGNNEKSPRKINLFSFQVVETTENKIYSVQVSYVPEGDDNQEFYTYDYQQMINGQYNDVTPAQVGMRYPERFLLRFLNLSNLKTGFLGKIKKSSTDKGYTLDNMKEKKTTEGIVFEFYQRILKGEDFQLHHKGNDSTRKWKYEVTPEEESRYIEGLAKLFRQELNVSDLNAEYGDFFRRQLASASRDRGVQQPYTANSDETPSF